MYSVDINWCRSMDPPMILGMQYVTGVEAWTGMQYVTGVEAWTQLVYKPGPTFDIRNAIGN
jgi:hypothetical protein